MQQYNLSYITLIFLITFIQHTFDPRRKPPWIWLVPVATQQEKKRLKKAKKLKELAQW